MRRNVEIKATVSDPVKFAALAASLTDRPPEHLNQSDTFFNIGRGRLKLRVISGRRPELIYYLRENSFGPKKSRYRRFPVVSPRLVCKALSLIFGIRGEITKNRIVYHVGNTRIHLDTVQPLGHFVELEVVLDSYESEQEGILIANRLMKDLQISESQLVSDSYIDLLKSAGAISHSPIF
jgi:adenylate cyclase class IV